MGEEERAARSRRHRRAVSPQTPPHGVLHAGTVGHVRVFRYRAFEIVKRLQDGRDRRAPGPPPHLPCCVNPRTGRRRADPDIRVRLRASEPFWSRAVRRRPHVAGVPCGAVSAPSDLCRPGSRSGHAPRPHARAGAGGGPGPPSCNGTDPTVFLNWEFAVPGHGKVGEQAVL